MDLPGTPTKTCTKCKVKKHISDFPKGVHYSGGYRSWCRKCCSENAKRHYAAGAGKESQLGFRRRDEERRHVVVRWRKELQMPELTREQLDALHKEYNSQCGVCGRANLKNGKTTQRQLYVDHNYRTGETRGLLCSTCYSAMCAFGDDLEGIERVVSYLKRYECKSG